MGKRPFKASQELAELLSDETQLFNAEVAHMIVARIHAMMLEIESPMSIVQRLNVAPYGSLRCPLCGTAGKRRDADTIEY